MPAAPLPSATPRTAWLWPCNVPHWQAWQSLQTQWHYAGGGMGAPVPTGINYAAASAWLQQAMGYHPRRRTGHPRSLADALHAVQACEHGALQGMAQARAHADRQR